MTPEYGTAFKETVKIIESLVEKGLIGGKQLKSPHLGMYYTGLKVKAKGRAAAIRENQRKEELEKVLPEAFKTTGEIAEAGRKAEEK